MIILIMIIIMALFSFYQVKHINLTYGPLNHVVRKYFRPNVRISGKQNIIHHICGKSRYGRLLYQLRGALLLYEYKYPFHTL